MLCSEKKSSVGWVIRFFLSVLCACLDWLSTFCLWQQQFLIRCTNPCGLLGTKTPKDDTMVIEELRQQNEDLRQHIMQLLLDNESKACHISSLFAENTHLHKKVTELESSHQSTNDVNKSALTENESETSSTAENEVTEKLGTSSRPVSELSHLWNAEDKQFFEQLYAQPDANLPPLNLPKFD